MKLTGGCYCGAVRYEAEGEPMMKAQCHCRECQYITGGSTNMFLVMPAAGFTYTGQAPKQFTRTDLERAVTREFCAECGTHVVTRPRAGPPWSSRSARSMIPACSAVRRSRSTPSTSSPTTMCPRACPPSSGCRRGNNRNRHLRLRWLCAAPGRVPDRRVARMENRHSAVPDRFWHCFSTNVVQGWNGRKIAADTDG